MPYKDPERKKARDKEYMREYRTRPGVKEKMAEAHKKYYQKNRESICKKASIKFQERYYKDPKKFYLQTRKWRAKNKEKVKYYDWKGCLKRYGTTPEIYQKTMHEQGNKCKICLRGFNEKRQAAADHCHKLIKFRAILCKPCNLAIAYFDENENIMLRAIEYLKTH